MNGLVKMSISSEKKPLFLTQRCSPVFLTLVVTYAVFVDQWVFAVIVPVTPFSLHSRVGVPEGNVQFWVSILLAVYGIACAAASPFWGYWVDRMSSRRVPFLIGLAVLFGATLMIWLGTTLSLQVAGRVLQGISTAIVWITGLALIADTVGQEEIGKYAGYLGIGMMVGTLVAPLVGGVVLATAGYAAVFELTIGLIILDAILRAVAIERKVAQQWIPAIAAEIEERLVHSKDHIRSGSRKSRTPDLIALLKSKRLLASLWAAMVQGAIFAGLESVLPLETAAVFGWDSIGGGLIFIPLTVPAFFGPLLGKMCDRYGARWVTSASFLAMCPFFTLMQLVNHNSLQQKVLLCALLTLAGCGFTATLDPIMAEVAYVVGAKAKSDPTRFGDATKAYAQAFSLFNMAWSIGNTFGPLMTGLIRDAAGWGTMSWVIGLLSGVTAVPTALWCGGWLLGKISPGGRKGSQASQDSV